MPPRLPRAFSLLEILITIAILAIISAIGFLSYLDFHRSLTITTTAEEVAETLRQAQQNALGAKNDRTWGVQFLSDRYILFSGSNPQSGSNFATHELPSSLSFTNIQLQRGTDYAIFSKLTGSTDDYGSAQLVLTGTNKRPSVISVNQVGMISAGVYTPPPCPIDLQASSVAATRSANPSGNDWHGASGNASTLIMRLYNTGEERADIDSLRFLEAPANTPKLLEFQARTVYNGWQKALVWEKAGGVAVPNSVAINLTGAPFYNRALSGGKLLVTDGLRFAGNLPNGNYQILLALAQTSHCVINFTLPGPNE